MDLHPPRILLINPWIHDFAAYDFWVRPMGLLQIAAILRKHGCSVKFLDCLDRFHPKGGHPGYLKDGRGPYRKTPIQKPEGLSDVPRTFSRYGIDPEWFEADLAAAPRPDMVFVSSLMTYWYTGVKETIGMIKKAHPGVPVVLGGIYATLLPSHAAEHTGADEVVTGPAEEAVFDLVKKYTGCVITPHIDLQDMNALPHPAFDLQPEIPYVTILTAKGCPNRCAYCASYILQPKRMTRHPQNVADEIAHWHVRFGVTNFAFYDDALLVDAENHAIPLLEALAGFREHLSFHTPNAIHVRPVTQKIAKLLYETGFQNIRLGVETTDFTGKNFDGKVFREEFVHAARLLLEAGFDRDQVGAYLLVGLPGQDPGEVEKSIDEVKKCGITPVPAYYTPIPHTRMWEAACAASRYDIKNEPLFTNNALMPCMPAFDPDWLTGLKRRIAFAKNKNR